MLAETQRPFPQPHSGEAVQRLMSHMRFAPLGILSNIAASYENIQKEDIHKENIQIENFQYTPENLFFVHKVSLLQSRYA